MAEVLSRTVRIKRLGDVAYLDALEAMRAARRDER